MTAEYLISSDSTPEEPNFGSNLASFVGSGCWLLSWTPGRGLMLWRRLLILSKSSLFPFKKEFQHLKSNKKFNKEI